MMIGSPAGWRSTLTKPGVSDGPDSQAKEPMNQETQDLKLVSELERILEVRIEVEKIFADPNYVSPLAQREVEQQPNIRLNE